MPRADLIGLGAAAALVLFLSVTSARATTFTVDSTADAVDVNPGDGVCAAASGLCTLRAAIMEANALGGPDGNRITLPAGIYTLTIPGLGENAAATGDLDVTDLVTIIGAGPTSTIVDGGGLDRVFEVRPGVIAHIVGVTIRNGNPGVGAAGGGILNSAGFMTLNSSVVAGNTAVVGGGIMNESGGLSVSLSTVAGNSAGSGGGIVNHGDASMSVVRSTVAGNDAAPGGGGGLWNDGGHLILNNSTVSGNTAAALGGGVLSTGGLLDLLDSTVAANTAAGGGGVANAAKAVARNTIVAGNTGGDCSGAFSSIRHNLGGDATCAFAGPGDLNGVDPLLGPLASNGGPTPTHALLAGSPARDAIPSCPIVDQRGVSRPQGAGCDIGAYEAVPPCLPPPPGLIGWWPMEDIAGSASLQDIVGGNHATPFASPVGASQGPQPVPGVVGGAMHFPKFGNGLSGARVSPQGILASVGAADFTIDAWVQVADWVQVAPAGANALHYIVNKFDTGQNRGYALYVVSPASDYKRLEFKWGDGTTVSTVQAMWPPTIAQWHHAAVTFARNVGGAALDIRLYIDGVQRGQQTGNPPGLGSLANVVPLEIGEQPGTLAAPLVSIDELEIFNVALPASTIQAIYNATSAGKCACTTGGQSVDLTVVGTGAVVGVGSGTAVTTSSPLTVNYSIQGCSGRELILILNAPSAFATPVYWNGSAWVPIPSPLSLSTPFVIGGPATSNGVHTLFSGSVPSGTYDVFLVCDLFVNGHLDVTFPPLCLSGAFDHLPLTVP